MIIGLVGKPSAGKSTFFKACTLANVEIANYPFTTIEANEGVGFVRVSCPHQGLKLKECNPQHGFCIQGERFVPVKLIDVAGLVPEAHKGKGRGNEFLDDLREADLLIHVLDVSGRTDAQGNPAENYNVCEDVKFLEHEIDMWIFGILNKNWKTLEKKSKISKLSEVLAEQLSGLKISVDDINLVMKKFGLSEKGNWNEGEILNFACEIRKKSKPIIIAANKADRKEARENIKKLKKEFPDLLIVSCSAESELALREAAKDKLIDYTPGNKEFKILNNKELNERQKHALEIIKKEIEEYDGTGVQECLNEAVFSFLKYITVYPVENEHHFTDSKQNILPDAYLLPQNSTALDLAYVVHSDIGKNFNAAIDCKTGKKLGKDSGLRDGDIVKIMAKT